MDPLLRASSPDAPAFVTHDETRAAEVLTFEDLRRQVAGVADALRGLGVGTGDRVVGYLPNTAVGAVWASVGADYAPEAAVDRLSQLQPMVLVAAD
ncbi:hypothetical protein LWC35_19475 [Pseudonocardia kujensis]|uniref:AMP-binding protein n=1 Tax=Pseudonocardia kujensis TaxID=1128675 RepID=UPI001E414983|nr:AMP-binding protein [Pseudonocardia kujensis]MCE0765061.1 hypothetical protein [Pseudonocardia kujensis]